MKTMAVLALVLSLGSAAAAPQAQQAPAPKKCELAKLSVTELRALDLLLKVSANGMVCEGMDFKDFYTQGCADGMVKPMKEKEKDPRQNPDYKFGFEREGEKVRVRFDPKRAGLAGFFADDVKLYCNATGAASAEEAQMLGDLPDVDEQVQALLAKQKKSSKAK